MVVKLADGAPLKGATVRLENPEDREHIIATRSTADGRFELKNVPAGRYKLIVSRNGYVESEYGQRKPSDPGATFTLSPGQRKDDIFFRLIPSAVIAGRVFNEDGEPEPNASVIASRQTYREGRKTMTQFKQAMTDDLGAFRLFGLPPGRYFISAMEERWNKVVGDKEFSGATAQGSEEGYARTYYPGSTDASRATAIDVKEGDEIPGADIALRQVPVHRVRGRVLNQLALKPGQDVGMLLVSRSKLQESDFGGITRPKYADGSFEVANVAPGSYYLIAFAANEGKMEFGTQRVEVGESDIEGVSVLIGLGTAMQGRVNWDGKPSQTQDGLLVLANSVEAEILPGSRARVDSSQQFALKDLVEGEYRVEVTGISKDCYLKQITFGPSFIKDDIISVSKGANPALEITLSSRGARVQGAVVDKDGLPAAGVWVVAVPEETRRTILRLFKAQTTDQYGKFDLHGLAPGEYKFFAWDGAEEHAWEDPDFLKPFEQDGSKMEVRDDDAATVNLTVIAMKREGGD